MDPDDSRWVDADAGPVAHPYTPERDQLLRLCQQPMTVADLAAKTKIPLGLVRVLLADLVTDGLVSVRTQAPAAGPVTDTGLLQKVLNGLQRM